MPRRPGPILFVCTFNTVRSPLAAALARQALGPASIIESAGVTAGTPEPFVAAVLAEQGLPPPAQAPRTLAEVWDHSFERLIALSPEAEGAARIWARGFDIAIERWIVPDPGAISGHREQRLAGFRQIRDAIAAELHRRLG